MPADLIRARIVTSETSWEPFASKQYFDEIVFESDLKRIIRLYQAEGYYQAQIVSTEVTPSNRASEPPAVNVKIMIGEGSPTRVDELSIEGLEQLPDDLKKKIVADLPLAQGAIFREEAYEALKALLGDRLAEAGFAEAEIKGTAEVRVAENRARVAIHANIGLQYRFGEIFVAGTDQIPRQKVYDEVRYSAPEGAIYNNTALDDAQRRLFNLGVFSAVKITKGAPNRNEGTIPVVATVREARFHTVSVGGGVAFDSRRTELPRITAEWTNRNLFGALRRLTFSNDVALAFIPNVFRQYGNQFHFVDVALDSYVKLEQPEIIGRNIDFTSRIGLERDVSTTFKYNAVRGNIGVIYHYGRNISVVPSYNLSVFALKASVPEQEIGAVQEAALDNCTRKGGVCALAYLEQRFQYDLRDNAAEPRRGAYVSLSFQEGSHLLGSNFDYLKIQPEVRVYFPVKRHVLAFRAFAGLIKPRADQQSSVLTRFFLGGTNSQRGFGNRELSPRIRLEDGTELPVGGNGMLGGNFEARIAIAGNFGLVVFTDLGEVTEETNGLAFRNMHIAVGAGLRYRTVFGPVRLDFGYRLNNPPIAVVSSTSGPDIAVGIPRYAIQFGIGEAF